jgi:hypothetical protein
MEEVKDNLELATDELVVTKKRKERSHKYTFYIFAVACLLVAALVIFIYLRIRR